MNTFAKTLLTTLRQMDTEANTTFKGSPTGLNFYGGYYRPNLIRPPTETSWTRRLKEMLTTAGYPTQAEVYYPGTKQRCDNVVTMPDGGLLWLENKGAWKQYWIDHGGLGIYQSYLFHPLKPGLMAKTHTVPHDLGKLATLKRSDAQRVGYLLIGFDSVAAPMQDDVLELAALAKLDAAPWTAFAASWPDRYRSGQAVHVWLWISDVV